MAFANNMTLVLNFIEKKLGLIPLRDILPAPYDKNSWAEEVIKPLSLVSFSTYYGQKIEYRIDQSTRRKNEWYIIDESKIGNATILGVTDIKYSTLGRDSLFYQTDTGYGMWDPYFGNFGVDDVALSQMRADITSLYNYSIYPKFEAPNKFRVEGLFNSDITSRLGSFTVNLLVLHSDNLLTIEPTKMELFKSLACADVADYLVSNLKHFENIETVYAQIQLHLDELRDWAGKAETIREQMANSFVSPESNNTPCIVCI